MLNLMEIREKWLAMCGSCDAGLPMECSCPGDDPRHTIMTLVKEVEFLRSKVALMMSGHLTYGPTE